jgi:hypothetical protein
VNFRDLLGLRICAGAIIGCCVWHAACLRDPRSVAGIGWRAANPAEVKLVEIELIIGTHNG